MTLADCFDLLNRSGCRIVRDGAALTLDIPPGSPPIPVEVLTVLQANREQLVAVLPEAAAPASREDDLRDLREYLAEKQVSAKAAGMVLHAADIFGVRTDAISIESDADETGASGPADLFEPGIPFAMLIDTEWLEPGGGTLAVPAGTVGLAIPQPWAIADDKDRIEIEAAVASHKRRKITGFIPVWLAGRPRLLDAREFTFGGVAAPDGMNLLPWRPASAEVSV
jgi:hypothetical protein